VHANGLMLFLALSDRGQHDGEGAQGAEVLSARAVDKNVALLCVSEHLGIGEKREI